MARRQPRYKDPFQGVKAAERLAREGNCPGAVMVFGQLSRDAAHDHPGSDEAASQVFGDLIHFGCVRRMR